MLMPELSQRGIHPAGRGVAHVGQDVGAKGVESMSSDPFAFAASGDW
jgi:hypothetical protein